MKAIILAAGRGERMRPLTNNTPKPLLTIKDKPLIQYHIENLVAAGISDIVINTAYLAEQFPQILGDGTRFGCKIHFSEEPVGAYETAGGIKNALALLGDEFIVVNGDVWTDCPLSRLKPLNAGQLAHLVMVPNPEHHPNGDFSLDDGVICLENSPKWTYSGIGRYSAELFSQVSTMPAPLGPILRKASEQQLLTGEIYQGVWSDIGTPERLAQIQ